MNFETENDKIAWFELEIQFTMPAVAEDEPTVADTINSAKSKYWKEAMEAEITQIEHLGTWNIVELPPNANIIPYRWVFCCK